VADALGQAEETAERAFRAELHRVEAAALERQARPREAEAAYRRAVEVASGQQAWLFALRAAAGLARLAGGALDALDALVARFPEAAQSVDLEEARALLGKPR
jgi:predicted ATPase